jgi:hypothetical protein
LYSSSNIIRQIKSRRIRWAGLAACMREERKVYRVLVGKPGGKRPHGRPRHRWENNFTIKVNFFLVLVILNSFEHVL